MPAHGLPAGLSAEEIVGSDAAYVLRIEIALRRWSTITSGLLSNQFPHGHHGGISTGFLDVAAGHARRDSYEVLQVEMVPINFGVAEDELEDAPSMPSCRERDGKFLWHASEDGFVDAVDSVRGAQDEDALRLTERVCGQETIPVGHEPMKHSGSFVLERSTAIDHSLCLYHGRRLMVPAGSGPQYGIDLIDEDDARLHLPGQRKDGVDDFIRVPIPLLRHGRDVKVDEGRATLVSQGFRQHGLAAPRRSIEKNP